ncbi:MAG: hypothetical protein JNL96_05805 [Planctomycetaceae bacterium]|nr:hypothetical protein [Planctomycetaceae bacterium]
MKLNVPKLDQFGFPIPPGFGESGVEETTPRDDTTMRRIRFVLRMALLAALATALWIHFDATHKARDMVGEYFGNEAKKLYLNNRDLPRALAAADRAVGWSPDNIDLLMVRCKLRLFNKDYRGSLEDVERAVAVDSLDLDAQKTRQHLYYVLAMHREGAAAAGELLAWGLGDRAENLNSRAYSRALGGFDLEAALVDIEEAIKLDPQPNDAFLDTRGYVRFKLGRHQEALDDIEQAIKLIQAEKRELEQLVEGRDLLGQFAREFRAQIGRLEEQMAVMVRHRGEVRQALGEKDEAEQDFRLAERLGFNPAEGVY